MVEEPLAYFFGIYIKFGYKNPSILTPYNLVDIALIIGRVTNAVAGMTLYLFLSRFVHN